MFHGLGTVVLLCNGHFGNYTSTFNFIINVSNTHRISKHLYLHVVATQCINCVMSEVGQCPSSSLLTLLV